jgi:hypothetical protein
MKTYQTPELITTLLCDISVLNSSQLVTEDFDWSLLDEIGIGGAE